MILYNIKTTENISSNRDKNQRHMAMSLNKKMEESQPSTAYIDIEINVNHIKQEPGLVQFVTNGLALVKQEILEDGRQDGNDQQCVEEVFTPAGTGSVNEACGKGLSNLLNVKHEPSDIDIEPTVLQHVDIHYSIKQPKMSAVTEENTTIDDCNKAMPSSRVKIESVEVELRANKDRNYGCDKCMKTFQSRGTFRRHCISMHETEQHRCTECDREFKCKLYLRNHFRNVHSKQHFECDMCNKIFKSKQAVRRHILRFHGPKSPGIVYRCDKCSKTYQSKKSLKRHCELLHSLLNKCSYKCTKCNREFNCKYYLARHVRRVHKCNVCKEVCKSSPALSDRVLEHKSEATGIVYHCDQCPKTYRSQKSLKRHNELFHSLLNKYLYKCTECNREFKYKYHLASHIRRIHFECDICKEICNTNRALTAHVFNHCLGESTDLLHTQMYACDLCQKIFWTKREIREHIESVHGARTHQCLKCNSNCKNI